MFISNSNNVIDLSMSTANNRLKEIAELSGLIDRRRYIHIFYDKDEPMNCKVIQINVSTTVGNKVLFDKSFMNRHNGTLTFVGVYTYDCALNTVGRTFREQYDHGKLTLLTAKRLDRETDHDLNITRNEQAQLFSTIYSMYSISDYIDARDLVNPKYYTQEHEYYTTGEFNEYYANEYSLNSLNLIGSDIVDDVTEILMHDPKAFDNVMSSLSSYNPENIYGEYGTVKASASDSIAEVNFLLGCDTMVNGGVFIYDTQMGTKPMKASVIGKSYMSTQNVKDELDGFMHAMCVKADNIEREHGSIRMMYAPSLIGSKCRIIYKDYNNSVENIGFGTNVSGAAKDGIHEVTEVIGELIEDNGQFVHNAIVEGLEYGHMEKEKLMSYY